MKKMLVVDDESLILFGFSATFKSDISVVTAATGHAALSQIAGDHFDICIIDLHLPDISGLDILRAIRQTSPGTRIIMMTGDEITGPMMRTIQENTLLLMDKPFDLDVVKQFVDRILTTGRPLLRDECRALKDANSFIKWIADDIRKHERKPVYRDITCLTVPAPNEKEAHTLSANVLDVSEAGMCLKLDQYLDPGCCLILRNDRENCAGVVRWSRGGDSVHSFLSGIQFVSPAGMAL